MPRAVPPAFMTVDLDRWRERYSGRAPLTEAELQTIAGAGAGPTAEEVLGVYEATATLVADRAAAMATLHRSASALVSTPEDPPPFVLGITGSVSVGKSTVARAIQVLIERWPERPKVQVVSTDVFLLPNAVLDARGLTMQKGYPRSYDWPALVEFLAAVKAGRPQVPAPVYSHVRYDVVPGEHEIVDRPGVLILEGLNVLQVGPTVEDGSDASIVSDHLDMSIYVDASIEDIEAWFIGRFAMLRQHEHTDTDAFYRQFAEATKRPRPSPGGPGTRSICRISWPTSPRPAPEPTWYCARAPTIVCARCCSVGHDRTETATRRSAEWGNR